jgi:TPR repeat protein
MKRFKFLLFVAVLAGLAAVAHAGFDDGVAAYNKGDYSKAYTEFKRLAEQGEATAQYNLGVMYHKGQGVQQDDVGAVKWWLKAAERGHVKAQFFLGVACDNGYGVPQNHAEAVKWYREAAVQGDADAQGALTPKERQEAQQEAQRAATARRDAARANREPEPRHTRQACHGWCTSSHNIPCVSMLRVLNFESKSFHGQRWRNLQVG